MAVALAALCGMTGCVMRPLSGAAPPRLNAVDIGAGLPQSGQWRQRFALADIDGDGTLELVHGPARKGEPLPVIFRRAADGQWARWREARFPAVAYAYGDVVAADFDGDAQVDLAFAMHLAPPLIVYGNGAGTFRARAPAPDLAGFSSRAATVADWNGDGRPDLVLLGEGPAAMGRGGFSAGVRIVSPRDGKSWMSDTLPGRMPLNFGDSVAAGDLDGDARPDIATATGRVGRRDLAHLSTLDWRAPDVSCLAEHAFVRAVTVADIDGTPPADLVIAQRHFDGTIWKSTVAIARWRDHRWVCESIIASVEVDLSAVATGDVSGDGATDLAVSDADGGLRVFLGNGRGGLSEAVLTMPPPSGCAGAALALADLDGDGRDEIVASFASEPQPTQCPSGGAIRAWRLADP